MECAVGAVYVSLHKQTSKQTNKQTKPNQTKQNKTKQTNKINQTNEQTNEQTNKQTNKQKNKQLCGEKKHVHIRVYIYAHILWELAKSWVNMITEKGTGHGSLAASVDFKQPTVPRFFQQAGCWLWTLGVKQTTSTASLCTFRALTQALWV